MLNQTKSQGIAIVAVLISAVVFLGVIIAITGTLSLSSRQSTSDQRVTLEAQYASESGLSRVVAEAQNGLLQSWTAVLLNMTSSATIDAAETQRLAKLFCNYPQTAVLPLPSTTSPPPVFNYCTDQGGSDQANRFDLFTTTLVPANYVVTPALTSPPTNLSQQKAFWSDVFSDGPSGFRYSSTVSSNVSYQVNFGLQVIGVDILNGTQYRFRFKARDAISTGRFVNGSTVLSNRVSSRSFTEEYYVDIAPPKLSYFLSLTNQQTAMPGTSGRTVYFAKDTLLDGPVHTNGTFFFRGNPWFSSEVTSAGCNATAASTPAYTTDPVTKVSTCSGPTTTGFYNDGDVTNPAANTTFTVTAGNANFPGYESSAPLNATAPEFALRNATAAPKPRPWDYTGKYNASIIPLPTASTPQRDLAAQSGILIPTSANPSLAGFYNDPTPEVYLQATTDLRSNATTFGRVPNSGKAATGQVIQMRLNQKISRCNAPATDLLIRPPDPLITVGASQTFSAKVIGQDTFTYEFAPTLKNVTWSATPPSTLTAGGFINETQPTATVDAGNTYRATAGYAVIQSGSAPVTITATTPGGISRSTTLRVNPIAPVVTMSASSNSLFFGGGTSTTLSWDFGTAVGPFTQVLEQSTNGGSTWSTVPGAPTTSDGTTNRSFSVSPTVNTRYRLTATGPTGLTGSDVEDITIQPPAAPAVTLSQSPTSNIAFVGGTRTLTWSVTNANATTTASGAGPGPYTFVVEQSVNSTTTYSTVTTVTGGTAAGGTFNLTIPANLTAANITRRFRVRATNTATTLTGTSNVPSATHLRPANPSVTLSTTTPMPIAYGGGPVVLNWTVSNNNDSNATTAAGVGPYTYTLQSSTNSSGGPWTTIGNPIGTTQTVNPTGPTWYNLVATNTTTNLSGNDWEAVTTATLPLPEITLTPSTFNVPAANTRISLSYTVRNAVDSAISGGTSFTIQSGATPNGVVTSGTLTNVNVPGPAFTDYTLTATNPVGTVTRTVRVYVNNPGGAVLPPPPIINTFVGTPPTVYFPDNASTLSWTLGGGAPTALSINSGVGSVLGQSSRAVTLTTTTTYTLTASNPGGSVTLNTTVTVVPAVAPAITLDPPSVNPVPFSGGNTVLTWRVTNPTGSGAAGAGSSPYTYVVQELVAGNWVTRTTQTGQGTSGSFTYTAPANATTADVVRPFHVLATNTSTNLNGTSNQQNVTVSGQALPLATISANPTNLPFGGGTTNLSLGVSNNTTTGAGPGPYTYTVERRFNGGAWSTLRTNSPVSLPDVLTSTGTYDYRVTATNTLTGRISTNAPTATVTVAPPPAPTITDLKATPNPFPTSAGGSAKFDWTLGGGPVTSLSMDQGIGPVSGTSKSGVNVTTTTTYTLTATGPGGTATRSVTVTVPPPPQTLSGLTKTGADTDREEQVGTITPGWKATPAWTGTGAFPTVTAGMYNVSVSPAGGALTASADANGNITLNIGTLPAGQQTYTVSATLTVNGVTRGPVSWRIIVTKKSGSASIRPQARLTQTVPTCGSSGGPVSYDWNTFVDYYIDKDNNMWSRTYPSRDQNAFTRPTTTDAPWVAAPNKFNGVVYVDGGVVVRGPSRTNPSDLSTTSPAVANFAALTLATDGKLTVVDDMLYENPVCTTSPTRGAETIANSNNGVVTPATCETDQSRWSRNVLGLFSSAPAGIEYKTINPNTTIQAISLASQGSVSVAGLDTNVCPDELLPSNNLGSINVQGGLIQNTYGLFGKFNSDTESAINCGYKRTMTYDTRMRQPQYAPPGFPEATNAKPTITLKSSSNPTQALVAGDSLPLVSGFSRSR